MTCKRCNNELPENARFCMACGALQPMVCPACQAESRPGSRTCSACGKKLPVVNDSAVKFYRRKKSPTEIAAMVLLVAGALLVLTAAIMFLIGTLSDVSEKEPLPEQTQEVSLELEKELNVVVEDPVKREETTEDKTPEKTPEDVTSEEKTPEEETSEEETPEEENPEEENPEEENPEEENSEEETPEEETPEEETPESGPSAGETEWFFPDSSERLLTDADIAGLSKAELQIARNEIYARHGRRFNNPDLQAWFDSCSWYEGTIAPDDFNEQEIFNQTELANVYFLKAAE